MSDDQPPGPPESFDVPPTKASDAPSTGDALAIGIGCLVTIILLGAAVYLGMMRG